MKLRELPTFLLRELAARCSGLNATLGDKRVALLAVVDACWAEIDRRVEGGDFPELSREEIEKLAVQIKTTPPGKFRQLLFDLEL